MFEQVRLESYVDRNNKFAVSSLHFDDFGSKFDPDTNFRVKNWDIVRGSMQPQIDELNNFNGGKGDFDFDPSKGENRLNTNIYKNDAAIAQAGGREIFKLFSFPNLYDINQVIVHLEESIKLASATSEMVNLRLNARSFLIDLSEMLTLDVDIGSVNYSDIPALVREVGYDPEGPSIIMKLWNLQLINFPGTPGHTGPAGTVGGYDATITQE